ncbi:MAG: DUF4232 domain-containing protein, partial [Gaiellaceae bacterium]
MRALVAMLLLLGLVAAGCGGSTSTTVTRTVTTTRTVTSPSGGTTTGAAASACIGSQLAGKFTVVPGSPGAGQISYLLTLVNISSQACFVTGVPKAQLLDASGNELPTNVQASHPGQATAAKVTLGPGDAADAEARFSPDVPGTGDHTPGQCQPTATMLRVTPGGGGTVAASIQPPTSV